VTLTIVCHHGSPGTPREFDLVAAALPDRTFLPVSRPGYPGYTSAPYMPERVAHLGYSWGCVAALRAAVRDTSRTAGVLLLAPFVSASNVGLVARTILRVPVLGDRVLVRKLPGIVAELLEKSCRPDPVPDFYRDVVAPRLTTAAVRSAILEKTVEGISVSRALSILRGAGVPLGIIRGDRDALAPPLNHAEPLKRDAAPVFEQVIAGGGHALHLTRPKQVAVGIDSFLATLQSGDNP
jgi:pimeloyl-ACP methyl ester carboxylesterase